MLWRYHYVITTAITFTTCDSECQHKEKKMWTSCGALFIFHFTATFTTPAFRKKTNSFFNFLLRSLRHGHAPPKKFRFSTTFMTPWSWQKVVYIKFHKKWKKVISLLLLRSLHLWSWQKKFSLLLLRSLRRDHDKKYLFFFQYYVHYSWLRKKIF